MGLSENSVPLNPLDYHHFPYQNSYLGVYCIFRHTQIYKWYVETPSHGLAGKNVALSQVKAQLKERAELDEECRGMAIWDGKAGIEWASRVVSTLW